MPERFVPLVRDQRAAVLGAVGALREHDWERPTACRGWTVKDVLAHLVEGELLAGRVYRGELRTVTPDDADGPAGVDRWRRSNGETVRYSLWHHGEATQRVIEGRSTESWGKEVTFLGRAVLLRHVLRLHFFELALHGLDITAAVGAPSPWEGRAAAAVEYCIRMAPAGLSAAEGAPRSLVVRIPGTGSWTVAADEGSWRIERVEASDPTVVWETDPETVVLTTTGRLEPGEALSRSVVVGDAGALAAALAVWRAKE